MTYVKEKMSTLYFWEESGFGGRKRRGLESGDIKLSFCSHGHKFMRRVKFYAVAIFLLHTPTHPFPNPLLCIVESIYVHISPNRHMIVIYNCKYKLKLLMTVYHTMETMCHGCRLLLLKSRLHVLSMPVCYIYIAAIYICDTCQM